MEMNQKLRFFDVAVDEDCRWVWDIVCDALYRWNNETGEMCRVGGFRGEKGKISYFRLLLYKEKLIGIPCHSDEIMIYDKRKNEFRYTKVGIPELHSDVYKGNKFMEGIIVGEYAFFSGFSSHVLKLNLETEMVEGYVDLLNDMPEANKVTCTQGAIYREDKLYVLSSDYNILFEVEPKTLGYRKIEVPGISGGFNAGCWVGDNMWLVLQEEPAVIKCDITLRKIEKINICLKDFVFSKYGKVGYTFFWNNVLWIISLNPEQFIGMDLQTGEWRYHKTFSAYLKEMDSKTVQEKHPLTSRQNGKDIMCLMHPNLEFILVNLENDTLYTEEYHISEQELAARRKEYFFRLHVMQHKRFYEENNRLEDYLRVIKGNYCMEYESGAVKTKSVGEEIYEKIKRGD